jgi:hypothetical protein
MEVSATLQQPSGESMPPLMGEVFAAWQRICGDRAMPLWLDFHLDEISPKALPWCAVVDVTYDPLDFIYRFYGTRRRQMQGSEYTGRSVKEIQPPKFAEKACKELGYVLERRAPVHIVTNCTSSLDNPIIYDILRAPFCNEDQVITQILTLVVGGPNFSRVYEMYGTRAPLFLDNFDR